MTTTVPHIWLYIKSTDTRTNAFQICGYLKFLRTSTKGRLLFVSMNFFKVCNSDFTSQSRWYQNIDSCAFFSIFILTRWYGDSGSQTEMIINMMQKARAMLAEIFMFKYAPMIHITRVPIDNPLIAAKKRFNHCWYLWLHFFWKIEFYNHIFWSVVSDLISVIIRKFCRHHRS